MGETSSKTQNLPEVKAMSILDTYEGSNNYILKLKKVPKIKRTLRSPKTKQHIF